MSGTIDVQCYQTVYKKYKLVRDEWMHKKTKTGESNETHFFCDQSECLVDWKLFGNKWCEIDNI